MGAVQRITDEAAAAALAGLLNGDDRDRPIAVVTVAAGRSAPWIDVDAVARETAGLARVYVMPTGAPTWAFSSRMPDGTQVYGGAGRVYPVGHEWIADLSRSPLRFAYDAKDGEHATGLLISDALRMANAAGLLQTRPSTDSRVVSGVVQWVGAGRALVDIGESLPASIVEELSVGGVPIDRLVAVGQHVEGRYDTATRRLDVTASLRRDADALSAYSVGDVVLATVTAVRAESAVFTLYPPTVTPATEVLVDRADVTANPADDLRSLLTVGEVAAARVMRILPAWGLRLDDVDDDEPIAAAPPLLPGGPPWLTADDLATGEFHEPTEPHSPAIPATVTVPPPAVPGPRPPQPPASPPVPTPAALRPRNSRGTPPSPPAASSPVSPSTQELLRKIDGLNAEVGGLERARQELETQVLTAAAERDQLRRALDQAERRAGAAENNLKAARVRLRKAGASRAGLRADGAPVFADPEQGFRYLVLTRWAVRIPPAEQAERPLPRYAMGSQFMASLGELEGVTDEKVADVVVEIVTGLAPSMPGRQVHQLRTGNAGGAPARVRSDGAVAWRASLQVNTPSARRIHYWVLPDGTIELARVARHDDFAV